MSGMALCHRASCDDCDGNFTKTLRLAHLNRLENRQPDLLKYLLVRTGTLQGQ